MREIPHLNELRSELEAQGLVILGANRDKDARKLQKFLENSPIQYTILPNDPLLDSAYGPIKGIPHTVVIDREGRIRERLSGAQGPDKLRQLIRPLLAE